MFNTIIGWVRTYLNNVIAKSTPAKKSILRITKKYPFGSLFVTLGILVALIGANSFFIRPVETTEEVAVPVKTVSVYRIGEAPTINIQAQVEKSGVITITAQTSGVVQKIYFNEGKSVLQGQTLISLSSNYQGGNAAAVQTAIAARTLINTEETYDTQKDIISKQIDLTNKTDENSDELRSIASKSLQETRDLISLNTNIIDTLKANLAAYEAAGDDSSALSTKQLISSYTSANNSLNSALRNNEYSSSSEKKPAEISNLSRDITVKQLKMQQKAIDLGRDISRLQLQLARIMEATMYPSSPFNGTVQRVFVKVGEAVSPGTPLVQLSQVIEEDPIIAIAYVPLEIAESSTYAQPSILTIGKMSYEAYPSYITQDAIKGTLYGIYFPIPDSYSKFVTENGYINVKLPVGYADTSSSVPYIPLDSVYQTQNSSYVFVIKNGKAQSKEVQLGPVLGGFVEVVSGLSSGDTIILDRTIVTGDNISIK